MSEPVWTCRDGRKVALSAMVDRHLVNAYKMLRRAGVVGVGEVTVAYSGQPNGDGALDAWLLGQREIEERPQSVWIDRFEAELQRRGLPIPEVEEDPMLVDQARAAEYDSRGRWL